MFLKGESQKVNMLRLVPETLNVHSSVSDDTGNSLAVFDALRRRLDTRQGCVTCSGLITSLSQLVKPHNCTSKHKT